MTSNLALSATYKHMNQSHRLERVVPTASITMFQLLISLIHTRDTTAGKQN